MNKTDVFSDDLQAIARFAKALSHPARLAILKYLSECKSCISGNIADYLPLSRSTVSQHLTELKEMELIQGSIDGLKINYCVNSDKLKYYTQLLNSYLEKLQVEVNCKI
ncbi:MAG: ArsR family transcriptional regulator [Bacteroidales bacterium]|nr:ArsR family transcriptional regulator [Bacteroidales bacterium]